MIKHLRKLLEVFKDKSGQYSSIRVIAMCSLLLLIYQLYEFRIAFHLEIAKENVDYQGLSLLFTTMIINFVFVVVLKVVQKKFE